jgi:hypothetical protein
MRGQRKNKHRAEQSTYDGEDDGVKLAEPVKKTKMGKPLRMLRQIVSHPDFGYQCMVVLLSLTQNNVSMDRRIDTMTSSIDTLRNIAGVLTNATQSLKSAAEAPRQIRRLVKPDGS